MTPHALITGSSRGIGLSIAHLLARNSHRITLLSRSPSALTSALSSLPPVASSSLPHRYIAGDVSSPRFWSEEFGEKFMEGKDEGDKIDVLVNCAGITREGLFARASEEEVREVLDTNLTGLMVGTRWLLGNKCFRGRKARGEGGGEDRQMPVIINVASLLGIKGGRGAVAYATSKAGVLGFTRALATELGPLGIRVNAVVPGYIETDMTEGLSSSSSLLAQIPLKRFGTPEEVAHAALFLIQNQYAHNCVLNLDGGLSAV
ncbi:NAD(P)-binding protein [Polyplosphaeria fusca]|uniref:NAD(P)-binding protein n=1 Tax=Polyplosphaeria fusca TaxID=682080 RepID=A0A9P4QPL0_9PLEO|nr:NAD(P)-binding protein [Polyplosphaeria fusca]